MSLDRSNLTQKLQKPRDPPVNKSKVLLERSNHTLKLRNWLVYQSTSLLDRSERKHELLTLLFDWSTKPQLKIILKKLLLIPGPLLHTINWRVRLECPTRGNPKSCTCSIFWVREYKTWKLSHKELPKVFQRSSMNKKSKVKPNI